MNYKIVYFTRTGNSYRIAEKLGEKLSCNIIKVTDDMNWKGIIGFIKAGYYASKNKDVNINISEKLEEYDELIVISPLWAGGIAPAIKCFLKDVDLKKVSLIITSNGSIAKETPIVKRRIDIIRNQKNEDQILNGLIESLKY